MVVPRHEFRGKRFVGNRNASRGVQGGVGIREGFTHDLTHTCGCGMCFEVEEARLQMEDGAKRAEVMERKRIGEGCLAVEMLRPDGVTAVGMRSRGRRHQAGDVFCWPAVRRATTVAGSSNQWAGGSESSGDWRD